MPGPNGQHRQQQTRAEIDAEVHQARMAYLKELHRNAAAHAMFEWAAAQKAPPAAGDDAGGTGSS
jgi:hypothetical protein